MPSNQIGFADAGTIGNISDMIGLALCLMGCDLTAVCLRERSGLHDIGFRALDESDHFVMLLLRDLELVEGGMDVPDEDRPVTLVDTHALVRDLHVSPGVIQGATRIRAQKVDEELFLSRDAVVSPMLSESAQL